MYERAATGWAKHLDFIILDMICLEIAFLLAYMIRHGINNPYTDMMYRNIGIVILFVDFALLLFMDTLKDVMKRGVYKEFVRTLRHAVVFMLVLTAYMFATQEGNVYSRTTIFVMCGIYFCLSYVVRLGWKRHVKRYSNEQTQSSLLIISSESRAKEIMDSIHENGYGHYRVAGWHTGCCRPQRCSGVCQEQLGR